jgi:hypothetical protein
MVIGAGLYVAFSREILVGSWGFDAGLSYVFLSDRPVNNPCQVIP